MCATIEPARALPRDVRAIVAQSGFTRRAAPDVIEVAECERVVCEELARPDCSAATLAARLLDLGFPPLESAWDVLWSAERREGSATDFAQARVAPLEVLELLALSVPAAGVRRSFAARIVAEPSAEDVLWIADYLTEHGSWREVDLAFGLSRVDSAWLGLDPALLHDRVESALTAMLARDPMAYGSLRTTVAAAPQAFGSVALDALAEMSGDRALSTLFELLELRRLDASEVLGAIEDVGRRCLPPFDPYLLQRLRELAAQEDPSVRGAALRAAGALGDEESLPLQLEGLAQASGAVRSAAGAALTELTGLRFGSDARRWLSWYAGERRWWDERAPAVLERLAHDDVAVVIAALAEIVPHRLQRDRSARAVAGLLGDESPELRRLACLTLEQLGGRVVAPEVVERLADVDETVRASAHRCLQRMFGLELPPGFEIWRAQLERGDVVLR